MAKIMKSLIKRVASYALLAAAVSVNAATYTVDPGASWLGFMNVFATGGPGYGIAGAGGYVFGSGWGIPDPKGNFCGPIFTLSAHTNGDPHPLSYNPHCG